MYIRETFEINGKRMTNHDARRYSYVPSPSQAPLPLPPCSTSSQFSQRAGLCSSASRAWMTPALGPLMHWFVLCSYRKGEATTPSLMMCSHSSINWTTGLSWCLWLVSEDPNTDVYRHMDRWCAPAVSGQVLHRDSTAKWVCWVALLISKMTFCSSFVNETEESRLRFQLPWRYRKILKRPRNL